MRKNIWLFNLYSKSLQKSGLFYGFPSPQKLQKLYVKTIKKQNAEIAKKLENCDHNIQVNCLVVLTGKYKSDKSTIEALLNFTGIRRVYVTGRQKSVGQVADELNLSSGNSIFDLTQLVDNERSIPLFILSGGDLVHSQAITLMHSYLADPQENKIVYCDVDYYDKSNVRHSAEFYPDWNPDLQLATGYIKTGVMISGVDVVNRFCHFANKNTSTSLLAIWLADNYLRNFSIPIVHIPFSLVHKSVKNQDNWEKQLSSLNYPKFTSNNSDSSEVAQVKWDISDGPLVSLIIPTKNAKELVKNCIDSIISKTSYANYEILLVDNNSDDADSLAYFEQLNENEAKVRVLKYPFDFNYSAINNFAVNHANGSVVGLVNNDIEVISADWLDFMVGHVIREDIGCVGAKLLYPDNRIQHAGVVMGYGGGAGHAHKYFPRYHPGYLNRLIASHNFSAVTAACLLVKKSDYLAVNGLNETDLTVAFNDVDFCLRVLQLGRRNLYCAEAVLYHHESISRGLDDTAQKRARFESELTYLQETWHTYIVHDPAYNSNLTLKRENFSIKE
ncbi:glycosyltransferase family 2 protein [Aliiglaciecola lipolytica]|uniref:glycosyltransferase family 2 protein n=1 Tax=Aliiglaciecola lipolytica TaxID=477689 RepID=UPI002091BEE2|nr:glycosyltransferase [Aliiglaciecola lipolytica]